MIINLTLQGGLGNQLFELFYATLYACKLDGERVKIRLVLDYLSKYKTARGFEVLCLIQSTQNYEYIQAQRGLVDRLRVPKFLSKIFKKDLVISVLNHYYFDGYYQDNALYTKFREHEIGGLLNSWAIQLREKGMLSSGLSGTLLHIRLGDFFKTTNDAEAFLIKQLENFPKNVDIITDQEDLVLNILERFKLNNDYRLINTSSCDSWDIFRIMSGYSTVVTNGSTLAFWATLLSGGMLNTTDGNQQTLHQILNTSRR